MQLAPEPGLLSDPTTILYSAFISHSHRDRAAATRIQRRLETYRLPRVLRGNHAARLRPVFRDRDELVAASDLDNELRAALIASDFLIVVCSPDAAASLWVKREIEVFRELKGDRNILAAIVRGNESNAFPPGLKHVGSDSRMHVPLAADFQRGRDGPRLALLKLVAPLAGVRLDALIRRDSQRRQRHLIAPIALALASIAILATLLVRAIEARHEADRQRTAAESLVEFMVGDLRTRLEPMGKLSVLDAIGDRALAYYQHYGRSSDLGADSIARRARVLRMVGDIETQQGNLLGALQNFRAAAESTAHLLELEPNDPQRIFDHAQSVYFIGSTALQRRHLSEAQRAFEQYRDLAERLVRLDPTNPAWQPEPGYAASNLGTALLERGRNLSAEVAFRRAFDISKFALRKNPNSIELKYDLAQSYAWLADVLLRLGRFEEAMADREEEVNIYQAMLDKDSDNRKALSRLINAEIAEARITERLGNRKKALGLIKNTEEAARQLSAKDSRNVYWKSLSMGTSLAAADMSIRDNSLSVARYYLNRATTLSQAVDVNSMPAQQTVGANLNLSWSNLELAAGADGQASVYALRALQLLGPSPDLSDRSLALKYLNARINLATIAKHKRVDIDNETESLSQIAASFKQPDIDIAVALGDLKRLKMSVQ